MPEGVRLHGVEQALRGMREAPPKLQKNVLRSAIAAVAGEVRDTARSLVPEDTGNLRRNIVSKRGRGRVPTQVSGIVVVREERGDRVMSRAEWRRERFKAAKEAIKNAFYWRFVEWGTSSMPARPYLRPAFDLVKATFVWRFARLIRQKFDRAVERAR